MHIDLRSLVKIVLAIILINTLVFAQSPQKMKLLGVSVTGNNTVSESSIKVQSGLITGRMVDYTDISEAVRNLWDLRVFSDVQVLMDKATEAGLFVIIQVAEYPRLGKVEINGNKKISDSKINEEIYLLPGKVLSPFLLSEISRKIKELYKEDGYLLAEVETIIKDTDKESTKDLDINIKENKRVRIDNITFTGNESFTDRKLRGALDKTKQRFLFLFRLGKYDKDEYEEDKKLLRTFYRNHGYRDVEVVSDTISYTDNKKRMNINIEVREGKQYKYRNITFSGSTLYEDEMLAWSVGCEIW